MKDLKYRIAWGAIAAVIWLGLFEYSKYWVACLLPLWLAIGVYILTPEFKVRPTYEEE